MTASKAPTKQERNMVEFDKDNEGRQIARMDEPVRPARREVAEENALPLAPLTPGDDFGLTAPF